MLTVNPWTEFRRRRRLRWSYVALAALLIACAVTIRGRSAVAFQVCAVCAGLSWCAFIAAQIRMAWMKCPACGTNFFRGMWGTNLYARCCMHCGIRMWSDFALENGERAQRILRRPRCNRAWFGLRLRSMAHARRLLRTDSALATAATWTGAACVLQSVLGLAMIELQHHALAAAARRGQPAPIAFTNLVGAGGSLIARHAPIAVGGGVLLLIAGRAAAHCVASARRAIVAILLTSIGWLGAFAYDGIATFSSVFQGADLANALGRWQAVLAPLFPVMAFALLAPIIASFAWIGSGTSGYSLTYVSRNRASR
jgi:hypothetical protein